jgi:hypothetical protein
VNEKVDFFDYLEAETWSLLWFDDFVQQLGYPKDENVKFFWLLPGKSLADGLRIIWEDKDINAMVAFVAKINNYVLYFDHVNMFDGVNWEDIVVNPVVEVPTVMSPRTQEKLPPSYNALPEVHSPSKGQYVGKKQPEKLPVKIAGRVQQFNSNEAESSDGQRHAQSSGDREGNHVGKKQVHTTEIDEGEVHEDESDFVDSDYEIEDGDDDVFENFVGANVDEAIVRDNKKAKGSRLKAFQVSRPNVVTDDENDSDEEVLELPDEEDTGGGGVFRSFRDHDMKNPTFSVGLVFSSVQELRDAIHEYSVKNRVEIKMPRNEKKRVRAHCAEGCPWNLYASEDSRMKSVVVKTYYAKHTCQKEWKVSKCTAKWIASKYMEAFRANEKMSITSLSRTIQKDWNLTPYRSKVARARRLILKQIHGDEEKQYNLLWDYGQELRRSNPSSSFFLNLIDSRFSTCYMSFDACKRGFLAACRPIICLDGCFIKTKHGGQLLTAVGIDPNDCIFPIAMAVVEVESFVTWKWFLETLKTDLNIDNTYPWTVMTDKQKVSNFLLYVT